MQRHLCASCAIPWPCSCQKISAVIKMTLKQPQALPRINHECLYPHKIVSTPCATPSSPGKSPVPMHKEMHVKDLWHCLDTTTQPAIRSPFGQANSEGSTSSCFLPSLYSLRCKADGDEQPALPRQAIKYGRLSTSRRAFAHLAMTAQSASAPVQEVIRPTAEL